MKYLLVISVDENNDREATKLACAIADNVGIAELVIPVADNKMFAFDGQNYIIEPIRGE